MGIVVGVLLYLKHLVGGLELHAYLHVESLGVGSGIGVVGILDILSLPGCVGLDINHLLDKLGVEVAEQIETSRHVDHRTDVAVAVYEMERRHTALL